MFQAAEKPPLPWKCSISVMVSYASGGLDRSCRNPTTKRCAETILSVLLVIQRSGRAGGLAATPRSRCSWLDAEAALSHRFLRRRTWSSFVPSLSVFHSVDLRDGRSRETKHSTNHHPAWHLDRSTHRMAAPVGLLGPGSSSLGPLSSLFSNTIWVPMIHEKS